MIVHIVVDPRAMGKDAIVEVFDTERNALNFKMLLQIKDKRQYNITQHLVMEYPNTSNITGAPH